MAELNLKQIIDRLNEEFIGYTRKSDHLQDERLSKIIQTVEIKGKTICVFADSLPVMDDVGGVQGYIDFLMKSIL